MKKICFYRLFVSSLVLIYSSTNFSTSAFEKNRSKDWTKELKEVEAYRISNPESKISSTGWITYEIGDELNKQFEQISSAASGRVGVAVELIETRESASFRGYEQFPMQSVYKLPIAMALLDQVDRGLLKLDTSIYLRKNDLLPFPQYSPLRDKYRNGVKLSLSDLLRFMVSESDNTACDKILQLIGGPKFVTQYLYKLGINNIIIAATEKEMGTDELIQYRNWATPKAMVALLNALYSGSVLSKSSQSLLLKLMIQTSTGSRRIKSLLPQGTIVAHKTGSSPTVEGFTRATNDVGIVTLPNGQHLIVVVFVSDSTGNDTEREEVIAKIGRAAWDHWNERIQK